MITEVWYYVSSQILKKKKKRPKFVCFAKSFIIILKFKIYE